MIWQQLFLNDLGAFFVADVVVSSLALWVFIFVEGGRLGMKYRWAYVLANLCVGVSLALSLFLYYRENYLGALNER